MFEITIDGKPAVVEYEPDTDLRDTEQIPLQEEGGIEAFVKREVLPYAADAWYQPDRVKIGYEISFNPLLLQAAADAHVGGDSSRHPCTGGRNRRAARRDPRRGQAMIADLKPYPAMKDSGVEWLGEMPAHWEVRRLKHICRMEYGGALASEVRQDGAVPVFGSNGCVGFHNAENTGSPCVVVGRKGSFGKVHYSPVPAFAIDTTFFVDERFSTAHIRWLYFLLGWLRLDEVSKDSAVPGLDRGDAYERVSPLPPLPEQTAIVRFLDHADRRIRRYIRAKQKLIALLEEQKQAIIQQAVTGQIDVRTGQPYPAYKDSGVEWLGEVPAHWEVLALKRMLTRLVDCEHKTAPVVADSNYYVVRTAAVRGGVLHWEGTYYTDNISYRGWTKRCIPKHGDVIFTREAPAGEACLVPEDRLVCLGQRTVLLRPKRTRYDPSFLVHMIYAYSSPSRSPIPAQADHPFQVKPITDSSASRSRFRPKPITFRPLPESGLSAEGDPANAG